MLAVGALVLSVAVCWAAVAMILVAYALLLFLGCEAYHKHLQSQGPSRTWKELVKCFFKTLLLSFKLIYKAGKWAYKAAFKKGNSTTTKAP